uniref:Inner membrane protein n=1 Tax=Bursaphelenchus xylophilus TaxID=6326 RepID=A0A1I7SKT8_BURXY
MGRFNADVGHAILTNLALGPALGFIALCGLIHNVFSEMWETAASAMLLLVGSYLCVCGLIMADRHVDDMLHLNITGFTNNPSYNKVWGPVIYMYGCSFLVYSFICVVALFTLKI